MEISFFSSSFIEVTNKTLVNKNTTEHKSFDTGFFMLLGTMPYNTIAKDDHP